MNTQKWRDWRLNALLEEDKNKDSDDKFITIAESFYHLNSEAKVGFSIRQIKKNLKEIENQFNRAKLSERIDDSMVEVWTNTYKSIKALDERLHTLMESMYQEKQ